MAAKCVNCYRGEIFYFFTRVLNILSRNQEKEGVGMCQSKQLTDLSRLFLSPVTSQLLIEGVFTPGPIDFILEVKTQVIDTP